LKEGGGQGKEEEELREDGWREEEGEGREEGEKEKREERGERREYLMLVPSSLFVIE